MVSVLLLGFENHSSITLVFTPTSIVLAHTEFMVTKVMFHNTRETILKYLGFIAVLITNFVSYGHSQACQNPTLFPFYSTSLNSIYRWVSLVGWYLVVDPGG